MIEAKYVACIADALKIGEQQVAKAVELLDGGATIPFIARYRRDVTGNLGESQLEEVARRSSASGALTNRRNFVLQAIAAQGGLDDGLRAKIDACEEREALEDYYLPFKKRRPSKATAALDKGLGPLADRIREQDPAIQDQEALVDGFVRADKAVSSPEEALEGARFILAEQFAMDSGIRSLVRKHMLEEGRVTSRSTKNAEGKKTKFEAYYNFSEAAAKIPSHRLLAILRGVKGGFLRMDLTIDDVQLFNDLIATVLKEPGSLYEPHIRDAMEDAYHRHVKPAIERDIVSQVRSRSGREAIRVFCENTRSLLMAPAAGPMVVLGAVPDTRNGCRLAVLSKAGALVDIHVLSPTNPEDAEAATMALVEKHGVQAIAVSNGDGGRETNLFFRELLKKAGREDIFCVSVSDTGAAAYAASQTGRQELPDIDTGQRTAAFLGRRLQDPLAELVKLDPRHIGVGQYQHDVNQKQLREKLEQTMMSCVTRVGVDVNTACVEQLRYISGLQMGTAQNIVARRKELGRFTSLKQLAEVDGIGPKVFEQCAGFLRLQGGDEPLDATAIHPESYPVVEKMAASIEVPVAELIGHREHIAKINLADFETAETGPLTLRNIRDELLHPGRDPRRRFKPPKFVEGVNTVDDIEEGQELEGIVTNVTDFGAFVDIGIPQDGLVHLSQLANRFVSDPRQVVGVADVVKVKVIKIDKEVPRISLSIKAVAPPPRKRPRKKQGEKARESGKPRRDRRDSRKAAGERGTDRPRRTDKARRPGKSKRRPDRRSHESKGAQKKTPEPINTLLADQLALLRDKFNK